MHIRLVPMEARNRSQIPWNWNYNCESPCGCWDSNWDHQALSC